MRRRTLCLLSALLLLLTLTACGSAPAEDTAAPADVAGTWYRTGCHSGCPAQVTFSGRTEEGVQVWAECLYFSHSGTLEGTARFTGDGTALLEGYGDGFEAAPVTFRWEGDTLTVTSGTGGADLGFGANVTIDGTYTRGEPEYTNAGALDRSLTGEQRSALRELLGEERYGSLKESFTNGCVEGPAAGALPDGTGAQLWQVYYPTVSSYDLTLVAAEDGRLYYQSVYGFFTTDPGASGMPEL